MPQPDHSVQDPRIRRTRQLLRDGLRQLLREKTLDEILVQDITDVATVNRATFYAHYTDKFDLFNALIASDFRDFLKKQSVCFDNACSAGLGTIVLAVGAFLQDVHRDHAECSRQAASGPLMDAAITLAVRDVVLDGIAKNQHKTAVPPEVVASMLSSVVYAAVKEWLAKSDWRMDEKTLLAIVPLIQPLLESSILPLPGDAQTKTATASSPRKRSS